MDKLEADHDYGIEQMLARCAKQKDDCLEDPEQLYCALCGPIDEKQRKLQNYLKLVYEHGTSLYSRDPEIMCHKTGDRQLVADILELVWEMAEHIEGMVEDHLEAIANGK